MIKSRFDYINALLQLLKIKFPINNEKIRSQLGEIILSENNALTENLSNLWSKSPIDGVTLETWGVLFNAIVDGLALQALLQKDFSVEKTYEELEQLFKGLGRLLIVGDKR